MPQRVRPSGLGFYSAVWAMPSGSVRRVAPKRLQELSRRRFCLIVISRGAEA